MHLPSEHHTVDPSTGKVVELMDEYERALRTFADAMAQSMGYADAAEREASDARSDYYNEHT